LSAFYNAMSDLRATLGAELGPWLKFGSTLGALISLLELLAALGAELGIGLQGVPAVRAAGNNGLPPIRFRQVLVLLGHLCMRPNLFDRAAGLGCRHLHAQVRCTVLAQATLYVPARLAADPVGAARALGKVHLDLTDSVSEGVIMGLFPGC